MGWCCPMTTNTQSHDAVVCHHKLVLPMQVPILYVIMYDTTLLSALFDYVCVTLTTSKKCRLYQRPILTHSQILFSVSAFYCILFSAEIRCQVTSYHPYVRKLEADLSCSLIRSCKENSDIYSRQITFCIQSAPTTYPCLALCLLQIYSTSLIKPS